jgi:hypothetical protein
MRAASVSSSPITLATDQSVSNLALDGTYVYWATGSSVVKVPIGGGTITTLAYQQDGSMAVAVDDDFVYWATQQCGDIKKIAK